MRRLFFGLFWFALFLVVTLAACAIIIGLSVDCPGEDTFAVGHACGTAAGKEFADKYRPLIVFGAFVLALVGTIKGYLPGTKRQ